MYVRKRPHMDEFMEHVSKHFEIIVFTASQKVPRSYEQIAEII